MKSIRKDQNGIGHALLAVIIVAVIGGVGFVGYRVMQQDKTPPAVKTSQGKAVNGACMKVYNDKDLCKAAAVSADFNRLSYTAVSTSADLEGRSGKIAVASDGKGNSSVVAEGGGQSYNMVTISGKTYVKNGTNWIKYGAEDSATADKPSEDLKAEFSDANTPAEKRIQYKKLGKEKCGKLTCIKYEVTDPGHPGMTNHVWFDTKDYRLQRWYGKDTHGTSDFVISYGPVTITTPSPVVDAPSAGASGNMPTPAEIEAALEQAQAAQ